ncbi:MAG: hypothetical protein M3321_02920 [Actinomycetota bacterium]|nr:hypothetical protein [Actinomycetota bacterium]
MSEKGYEIFAGGARDGLVRVEVRAGEEIVALIREEERGNPIEEVIAPDRLAPDELERALDEARESYTDWADDEARLLLELEE